MTDDSARPHHYVFAHMDLRRGAQVHGAGFPALARDGRFEAMIRGNWDRLGEQFPPEQRIPSDGLSVRVADLDDHEVVLVTLPPADRMTEAHFAAIAVSRADRSVRYFTLEHSVSVMDNQPYTVLGEWVGETHANLGSGPDVDAAAFVAAVASKLAG